MLWDLWWYKVCVCVCVCGLCLLVCFKKWTLGAWNFEKPENLTNEWSHIEKSHQKRSFFFQKHFPLAENPGKPDLKGFKQTAWPTCRWRRKSPTEWGMPKPQLWQLPQPHWHGTVLSLSSWRRVGYKLQSSLLLPGLFSAALQKKLPPELLLWCLEVKVTQDQLMVFHTKEELPHELAHMLYLPHQVFEGQTFTAI